MQEPVHEGGGNRPFPLDATVMVGGQVFGPEGLSVDELRGMNLEL